MPLTLYLPNGMLGRIECPVEANPPVTLVVWMKNDKVIDLERNTRLKVNKQGTLVFKNVESGDEGRYKCTPYSAMGAGASSKPVQIVVRGKYTIYYHFLLCEFYRRNGFSYC